jgi:hypothetical protein
VNCIFFALSLSFSHPTPCLNLPASPCITLHHPAAPIFPFELSRWSLDRYADVYYGLEGEIIIPPDSTLPLPTADSKAYVAKQRETFSYFRILKIIIVLCFAYSHC